MSKSHLETVQEHDETQEEAVEHSDQEPETEPEFPEEPPDLPDERSGQRRSTKPADPDEEGEIQRLFIEKEVYTVPTELFMPEVTEDAEAVEEEERRGSGAEEAKRKSKDRETTDEGAARSEGKRKGSRGSRGSRNSRDSRGSRQHFSQREQRESSGSGGGRLIDYDTAPRFRSDLGDYLKDSTDFMMVDEKRYSLLGMEETEEDYVEEEQVVEEEEVPKIDREPYYERHATLVRLLDYEKLKNNILQKKLAIFFRRRKMEYVLRETEQQPFDTQEKYFQKLDAYGELLDIDTKQREFTNRELNYLREKRETKFGELTKMFEEMQNREKEIGFGLINTKTGNPIPDKLVERLINRQRTQMEQVCSMRLKFIQLKDMVAEKNDAIAALDKVGENLYLMDYEQLKVENRSYSDKIEERDEELTRLRFKCQNTIQILAHIREKSAALESDIDDLKADIASVDKHSTRIREQLNGLKQQRDHYRHLTNKLRAESGLLTEPELLRDMETSIEDLQVKSNILEQLKEENKVKAQQIRNIRRNIEYVMEGVERKPARSSMQKSSVRPEIHRGRPSIQGPELPMDAFEPLMAIKPKPAYKTNKNWKKGRVMRFKYRKVDRNLY